MDEQKETERLATRELATAIVNASVLGEDIPIDIDVHSDDPVALVQLDDAAAIIVRLAQEIEALQDDARMREAMAIKRVGEMLVVQSGTVTVEATELHRIFDLGVEHGIKHGAVVLGGETVVTARGMKAIDQADRKETRDRMFRVLADTSLACWDDEHLLDRLVAAARDEPTPRSLPPRHLPIGMAHSLDKDEVKALRALRLAGIDLVARDALERDPHSRLMFARVRGSTNVGADTVKVGELACVEVPANCSIHDADAQRMIQTLALADMIGRHWRDQEGVNAELLEQLANITDTTFTTNAIKED